MGAKVAGDISKYAAIFAQEAADLGKDIGKYVASKLKEGGSSDADVSKALKDIGVEDTKVSKVRAKGAPKKTAKVEEGPTQGPQPLSTEDFEAGVDQRLDVTPKQKDVSFPSLRTGPETKEGVLVGGAAGRTTSVEPGSELVPIGERGLTKYSQPVEAEYIDAPTTETGLVSTGRKSTTFIGTEKGIAAGEPAPAARARTVEERLRVPEAGKAQPPSPEVAPVITNDAITKENRRLGSKMLGLGATAAGLAGAGGIAAVSSQSKQPQEESLKGKRVSLGALQAAYPGVSLGEAQRRYQDDLSTLKETLLPGADPTKLQRLQEAARDRVYSVLSEGTEQAMAAKTGTSPAPVPGVGGKQQEAPSEKKPTTTGVTSQPETKVAKSLADKVNAARAGKGSDASVKKDTISTLDDVVKEVDKDPRFQNDPIRTDLVALRADAYQAYKEKANRNEWLDLAERALNAIGQFAAARSATGASVAGFPLSKTDYAGRTEQAFREYQAELGIIGEQARAQERAGERTEAAKEREIARRQRTISERLADERAARAEAAAERRAIIAAGGKEALAAARKETQDTKDTFARIGTTIRNLDDEETRLQKEIKAIQEFALSKDKDKSATALATASSLDPELDTAAIEQQISKKSGFDFPWSEPGFYTSSSAARQQVAGDVLQLLKKKFTNVVEKKKRLQQAQESGVIPTTSAAAPTAPASAGQQPPAGGKVITRDELVRYTAEQNRLAGEEGRPTTTPQAAKAFLSSQGYIVQD